MSLSGHVTRSISIHSMPYPNQQLQSTQSFKLMKTESKFAALHWETLEYAPRSMIEKWIQKDKTYCKVTCMLPDTAKRDGEVNANSKQENAIVLFSLVHFLKVFPNV